MKHNPRKKGELHDSLDTNQRKKGELHESLSWTQSKEGWGVGEGEKCSSL